MNEKTKKNKFTVILTTTSNKKEAVQIVQSLLEEKLIACGNIIENVDSLYWWQGKIEEDEECLVILKTHQRHFKEIHETIKKLHSYQVPELIAFPIIEGAPSYLTWLKEVLSP